MRLRFTDQDGGCVCYCHGYKDLDSASDFSGEKKTCFRTEVSNRAIVPIPMSDEGGNGRTMLS